MSILWSVPLFVAAALVLIVVSAKGSRLSTGRVTTSRNFWCPFRQRNVNAAFSASAWHGLRATVGTVPGSLSQLPTGDRANAEEEP